MTIGRCLTVATSLAGGTVAGAGGTYYYRRSKACQHIANNKLKVDIWQTKQGPIFLLDPWGPGRAKILPPQDRSDRARKLWEGTLGTPRHGKGEHEPVVRFASLCYGLTRNPKLLDDYLTRPIESVAAKCDYAKIEDEINQ